MNEVPQHRLRAGRTWSSRPSTAPHGHPTVRIVCWSKMKPSRGWAPREAPWAEGGSAQQLQDLGRRGDNCLGFFFFFKLYSLLSWKGDVSL